MHMQLCAIVCLSMKDNSFFFLLTDGTYTNTRFFDACYIVLTYSPSLFPHQIGLRIKIYLLFQMVEQLYTIKHAHLWTIQSVLFYNQFISLYPLLFEFPFSPFLKFSISVYRMICSHPEKLVLRYSKQPVASKFPVITLCKLII